MINLTQKLEGKQTLSKVVKLFIFLPLISLCMFLGMWQIERGQEKQDIYNLYLNNISKEPQIFDDLHENIPEFTKIKILMLCIPWDGIASECQQKTQPWKKKCILELGQSPILKI